MGEQGAVTLTFVVYLLVMLALGVAAWRRTADLADYILGGRRLGRWVTALSASASDMSGWLLLGLPGYAYAAGLEAGWIALGLLAGTWLNWRLMARRLRVFSAAAGNALTIPEYLARRFAREGHGLRVLSAAFILLFFLFYTSSGLVAGGKLFNTVFELPYTWAVTAGTLAIMVYIFLGGFLAVSWTDLVQGLLMAAALVAVPVLALDANGGWGATAAGMAERSQWLLDPFTGMDGAPLGVIAVLSLLGWGLGYFGQPHILARFKAVDRPATLAPARRIAVTWVALTLAGALATGWAGIPYVDPPLTGPDTEKVFLTLVEALFHPVVAGICLAAVLAAVMSTADSQLLVSSAALTEDFYRTLVRREASQRELVWVGRAAVIGIAGAAYTLALDPDSKVLELVAYAWAGFGAAFGPTLLLSLYWRRMTAAGAVAGILAGGLTVVVWKQLEGGVFDLYELVPGFAVSLAAVVVVSLLSPRPPLVVTALYDRARSELQS